MRQCGCLGTCGIECRQNFLFLGSICSTVLHADCRRDNEMGRVTSRIFKASIYPRCWCIKGVSLKW